MNKNSPQLLASSKSHRALHSRPAWIFATLLLLTTSGIGATTIRAPSDLGELGRQSDSVVVATALETETYWRGPLIFTRTDFHIETRLDHGLHATTRISVHVPGGSLDDREWILDSFPRFQPATRYLLFLKRLKSGGWRPFAASHGVAVLHDDLSFTPLLASQRFGETHSGADVNTPELLARIRGALESSTPAELSVLSIEDGGGAGVDCATLMSSAGLPVRWPDFDEFGTVSLKAETSTDQALKRFEFLSDAFRMWTGIAGTSMNFALEPAEDSGIECTADPRDDASGYIVFDDPCSDLADFVECNGTLGFGGPIVSSRRTHEHGGETWSTILNWVLVFNNDSEDVCIGDFVLLQTLAHELGHGLGFAHSSNPQSLMYPSCCSTIADSDEFCARESYPAVNAGNDRPSVDAGSDRVVEKFDTILAMDIEDDSPLGNIDQTWKLLWGSSPVLIESPNSLATEVRFEGEGDYLFAASVDDGELVRSDTIRVSVRFSVFQRGDSNGDGQLDISDPILTLTHLFAGEAEPSCAKGADANDSGELDLSDAIYLLSHLFLAGPAPAAPVDCGEDPTADSLTCLSSPCDA